MIPELKVRIGDLFDELDKEEEKKDRKFRLKSSGKSGLQMIIKHFERFLKILQNEIGQYNYLAEKACGRSRYHAKDIEKFSLFLPSYQDHFELKRTGYFLSLCINRCIEKQITLHTSGLYQGTDNIGFQNCGKKINVKGDVGEGIGYRMWSGEIIVEGKSGDFPGNCLNGGKLHLHGNVGEYAGNRMEGGEIIIYGNAGDSAGIRMEGGKIVIHGNAGAEVGKEMRRNAEIHLSGRYKSIGPLNSCLHKDFPHGKIYHKGKLIVQDGWWVK